MDGGYDDGYGACPCFWGREPGSLVRLLVELGSISGKRVLDAGCGEGKNAVYLARLGATVTAVDTSALALANAGKAWLDQHLITWIRQDLRSMSFAPESYDVVIMYGLLHCLDSVEEVHRLVSRLQKATADNGHHVLCALNARAQDLSAHPLLHPTLLQHGQYLALYHTWSVTSESDSDIHEVHAHNSIPHTHSLTRILAKKVASVCAQ